VISLYVNYLNILYMTITDSGISKIYSVGDILEIVDLFVLSGTLSPDDYNEVYGTLRIDAIGESTSNEFTNITLDDLANINLASDSDINNPKIRFKGYGDYKFIFYTNAFFTNPTNINKLSITVTVTRPTVTFVFKTPPSPDLGSCSGDNCDIINLTYTSTNNQILNTFDPYINNSLVSNTLLRNDIFGDIINISFSLIYGGVVIKNGGTYEIINSGTYYIDISTYNSTVFIVKFVNLRIDVDPVSYTNARFIGPISISYGNQLPSIFSYLTEDPISTPINSITTLNEPLTPVTRIILVDGFVSDSGITNLNESEIPSLLPGLYILKATINGTTIYGILNISKAIVEIYNSMSPTYSTIGSTVINFVNSIYVVRRLTNSVMTTISGATLTYTITFSPVNGSSPVLITTPTYTIANEGTLEIIATFNGNTIYKSATDRFLITIGPIPVDISLSKRYFITRSELSQTRIISLQSDMKNNISFINRLTGISLSSSQITTIKNDISIQFNDIQPVSRYATIYYRTTTNPITSSLLSSVEIVDYLNITDVLLPKLLGNANSISIKGIKVHDGSQITLNYTKNSVNSNITLTKNTSGQVYAIDSETNTSDITFIPIKDSGNNTITLTTSELRYLDDEPQHYNNMTDMPNGLYRAIVKGGTTLDRKYLFTNNTTQHIVLTDTLNIEIDILNYILDRINATNRTFTYLMEDPHLIYSSTEPSSNYKISSSYLRFKIGNLLIPSANTSNLLITPNLSILASKTNLLPIEIIPLNSTDTYLDVYDGTTKLNLTRSYTLVLPKMVINTIKSDIETWFQSRNIEFDTPLGITSSSTIEDKVNAIYTETVNYNNTTSTITTVIKNYEVIETIVLNTNSNDTSRPFWMGLINKLAAFKTALTTKIRENPHQYLTNNDIDNGNFSSSALSVYDLNGSNTTLDLEDFDDNIETYTNQLTSIPTTYNKLVSNEVNTIILKQHLLTSMVMIQKALINFISIRYTPSNTNNNNDNDTDNNGIPDDGIYNIQSTILNKTVSFIPSPFNGVYGNVNFNIIINIPLSNFPKFEQSYIYTYWAIIPMNISAQYTNANNQISTATLTLLTDSPNTNIGTGATFNNSNLSSSTNAEILLEGITSGITLKYNVTNIRIKGSTGFIINDIDLFHGALTNKFTFEIKKYRLNINKYFKYNYNLISNSIVIGKITQII